MKQVTYTQRACSVQHSAVPTAGCRLVPSALTRKGSADGAAETHHASHGKSLCEETALAFWGLPCLCKEPGEAKGWLMGFCFLLPWAIKGSQEKAAAALRYALVPKRDATRAVSTRPATIHRHPQQGHEPLHQDTDSQANKLLFFFFTHTRTMQVTTCLCQKLYRSHYFVNGTDGSQKTVSLPWTFSASWMLKYVAFIPEFMWFWWPIS